LIGTKLQTVCVLPASQARQAKGFVTVGNEPSSMRNILTTEQSQRTPKCLLMTKPIQSIKL